MSPLTLGSIAIGVFLLLSFAGLPLGFSFALVGFVGLALVRGWGAALTLLGGGPYAYVASFILAAVPLFILMGQFVIKSFIL